ncbi:hypothetical protein ACFXAZ_14140 [Streptomyces sp. NPDC059477]|uniref:hypothetical protein n=1 Tax=Streptomyces sp. NPDC059477 TaxID=3346847 RepID=UPI0036BFB94C
MRIRRQLLRSGPLVAAAALPFALAAGPAAAANGISVSTSGSSVSVTTAVCTQMSGSWGNASLINSAQTNFAQGRQIALTGTSNLQSAAWSNVTPGTYTVAVVCAGGNTAGTQSVIVSAPASPTISATSSAAASAPASASASASPRGVLGGVGGGIKNYGTLTLVAGGVLVGAGAIAAGWFLRRRSKPYRL